MRGPAQPQVREDRLSFSFSIGDLPGEIVVTTRSAGDLRPGARGAARRRAALISGRPWGWTRQVHGAGVVGAGRQGRSGDVLVGSSAADRPAMFAADCALLGVLSPEGVVAAVHAGWQGLCSGVIEEAAVAMRALGASKLQAVRGPCIGPECYEFGAGDLDVVAGIYGADVRAETAVGRPALDLAAGVRVACERAGVEIVHTIDSCTACARTPSGEPLWFSHRARRDTGRHALVVTERR
jgi:copper oxidase (laccase) domain-containing protein